MYLDQLKKSSQSSSSILCMGLDPVLHVLPPEIQAMGPAGIPVYFEIIFREMQDRSLQVAAFKPNQGYYLRYDRPFEGEFDGSRALAKVIELLRSYFPETPVIMDFKRGDIASSSGNYAAEAFEQWRCDASTISPYMGHDSVGPFLKYSADGKGNYILNRTSNPGAADLQNLKMESGGSLFESVAKKILEWGKDCPGTGAVVGATSLEELKMLAALYADADIPLLIPGVGSQGGSAQEVCESLKEEGYPLKLARINSSSGITHPWAKKKEAAPKNWNERVCDEIEKLNSAITAYL